MPTLYLMRHAQADNDSHSGLDVDRKLTSQGHEQAQRMARWLSIQSDKPQRILASPAQRTRQTALAVAKAVGIATTAIEWEMGIYSATAGTLLELIQERLTSIFEPPMNLLLVGHNPGLEVLMRHFALESGGNSALHSALGMSPASVAVISWGLDQAEGTKPAPFLATAHLRQLVHARDVLENG